MAVGTVANYTNGVKLGNQRAKEVLEYEKILKVHTDVVANVHPQLSLPSQPLKQSINHPQGLAPTAFSPRLQNGIQKQAKATPATPTQPKMPIPAPSRHTPPSYKAPATKTAPASSGFDPLFLTKADILVKAELHKKRQQIERALKEQLNQSSVNLRQRKFDQEILPNFNVMKVLKEAQQIVKPVTVVENNGTNRNASSSDSFDEKTFYSSQMNDSTTEEERSPRHHKKICKFFFDHGNCRRGNDCSFSHDPAHKEVLEADGPKAMDIDSVAADEQAMIRPTQTVRPNEPPHSSPPDDPGELAKLKHAEQIEKLEEQLRNLKSSVLPSATRPPRDYHITQDEAAYSPPDVAAPVVDRQSRREEIREPEGGRRKESVGNRAPPPPENKSREYIRQNQNPHSPVVSDVRVVRNHITSPVAPQPSRVSPLAVSRVPALHQGQRVIGDEHRQPRRSAEDVPSARHSPRPLLQDLNPRKRRRADSNGRGRFVIARRESPGPGRRQSPVVRRESPEVRIKEEPISPPPLAAATPDAWQPRGRQYVPQPIYVETGSPRYRDLEPVVYQPRIVNQLSQTYIADERRPQSPMVRRVISRNAQHVSAHEEQSLRRVVSARQLRIPRSPPGQYVPPQPSSARAVPQVYIPQASHPISVQPRASVQPLSLSKIDRDQSLSPRPVARLSPTMQRPTMAPPARRLGVDRYVQTFEAPLAFERQSSVVPVAHPTEFIPRYEQLVPRSPTFREQRLVNVYDDRRYVRRAPSPHYVEYHPAPASRHVLDREVEPVYGEDVYLPRHEPLRAIEYTDSRSTGLQEEVMRPREIIRTASVRPGEAIRTASVRPAGAGSYEESREPLARMQSVRPEQDGVSPLESRRIVYPDSIRTDRAMSRTLAYAGMERPKYRYTTETQERRYVDELPEDVIYEAAKGSYGRRHLTQLPRT